MRNFSPPSGNSRVTCGHQLITVVVHQSEKPVTPLAELYYQVENNPTGIAFVADRDSWTYARLAAHVERAARGLLERGIRKGDRVVLHLPNRPELVIAFYACFHIGAIAVPMNIRLKAAEITPLLQRVQPALYIGHADLSDTMQAIHASILPPERCLAVGAARDQCGGQTWETLLSDSPAAPSAADAHSHAVMLHTSGTTGTPKFVVHTAATLAATADLLGTVGFRECRRAVLVFPMVHASGIYTLIACMRFGASMIMLERFTPETVLEAIEIYRCDWMGGLPFMYDALLKSQVSTPRKIDSLRICLVAGDVCPPRLQRDFAAIFQVALRSLWAASEAGGLLTFGLHPAAVRRNMEGGEARLVDDEGAPVPQGETGELLVRGPNVSIGYWAGPDAIRDAPVEGWWRSGDLMRQDEKGDLWFVSRKKDLILRGGSNISPVEVERVLAAHPAVADAAVVGMPDDVLGQRVIGFVQLKHGVTPAAVTDILDAARGQLADYKVPERLHAIAAIPRNALGKADRKILATMLVRPPDCATV
jgi:long-chain acyl-CoA synthetase